MLLYFYCFALGLLLGLGIWMLNESFFYLGRKVLYFFCFALGFIVSLGVAFLKVLLLKRF